MGKIKRSVMAVVAVAMACVWAETREVKMLAGERWWGVMNFYGSQTSVGTVPAGFPMHRQDGGFLSQ